MVTVEPVNFLKIKTDAPLLQRWYTFSIFLAQHSRVRSDELELKSRCRKCPKCSDFPAPVNYTATNLSVGLSFSYIYSTIVVYTYIWFIHFLKNTSLQEFVWWLATFLSFIIYIVGVLWDFENESIICSTQKHLFKHSTRHTIDLNGWAPFKLCVYKILQNTTEACLFMLIGMLEYFVQWLAI